LRKFKILEIKPFNTTKYLNYLAFKEALNLCFNKDKNLSLEAKSLISKKKKIRELKDSMNTKENFLIAGYL